MARGQRLRQVLARGIRSARREDGQAMVELALSITVLLIVVIGIFDFGKAINFWNDENHLANVAARYAAVGSWPTCNNTTYATLAGFIQCEAGLDSSELVSGGGSTGVQNGVCVKITQTTTGSTPSLTATVSANYNWLDVPLLGKVAHYAPTSISGTATMRDEQQTPGSGVLSTAGSC